MRSLDFFKVLTRGERTSLLQEKILRNLPPTGHSTYDNLVQDDYVGTGNVISNIQRSSFIRPYGKISSNGHSFPEGHLMKHDLFRADVPLSMKTVIEDKERDDDLILYEMRLPSKSGYRDIGMILTDKHYRLLDEYFAGKPRDKIAFNDFKTRVSWEDRDKDTYRNAYSSINNSKRPDDNAEEIISLAGYDISVHPHYKDRFIAVPHDSDDYRNIIDGESKAQIAEIIVIRKNHGMSLAWEDSPLTGEVTNSLFHLVTDMRLSIYGPIPQEIGNSLSRAQRALDGVEPESSPWDPTYIVPSEEIIRPYAEQLIRDIADNPHFFDGAPIGVVESFETLKETLSHSPSEDFSIT